MSQISRIEAMVSSVSAKIDALTTTVENDFALVIANEDVIEQEVNAPPPDMVAVSAAAKVPRTFSITTGKEIRMPTTIMNDVITGVEVDFFNLAGQPVSPPAGGNVTVSLVDASGNASPLGTVAVGWPDGTHTDGSGFSITPSGPIGSALGDATVNYDDTSSNAGTQNDISFPFAITFGNDPNAVSAGTNVPNMKTFPFPSTGGATGATGATGP
jgi:hypothetical protein